MGQKFFENSAQLEEAMVFLAVKVPSVLGGLQTLLYESYTAWTERRPNLLAGETHWNSKTLAWKTMGSIDFIDNLLACETLLTNAAFICVDTLSRCKMVVSVMDPMIRDMYSTNMNTLEGLIDLISHIPERLIKYHKAASNSQKRAFKMSSAFDLMDERVQREVVSQTKNNPESHSPSCHQISVYDATVAGLRTNQFYIHQQMVMYQVCVQLIQIAQVFIPQHMELLCSKIREFEQTVAGPTPPPEEEPVVVEPAPNDARSEPFATVVHPSEDIEEPPSLEPVSEDEDKVAAAEAPPFEIMAEDRNPNYPVVAVERPVLEVSRDSEEPARSTVRTAVSKDGEMVATWSVPAPKKEE